MGWLGEGITMQGLLLGCAKCGLGTALLVGDGVGLGGLGTAQHGPG